MCLQLQDKVKGLTVLQAKSPGPNELQDESQMRVGKPCGEMPRSSSAPCTDALYTERRGEGLTGVFPVLVSVL